MKIVHAADLHLDSPLRGLSRLDDAPAKTFRLATREAFNGLIDLCRREEARLLLLAGDVFDGDLRDFHSVAFFEKGLARLGYFGCQVVLVRGNHDAASVLSRHLEAQDHVFVLDHRRPETRVFEELGLAVHGQSFATRAVSENLAAAYPEPLPDLLNFGVLHTNAVGASQHENYAPCTVNELVARGYDYWALGHVHRAQILHRDPWVVYPGNLQGRHARETGPKGAVVIEVEGGRIEGVRSEVLDVVRWETVTLSRDSCQSEDSLLDALSASVAEAAESAEGRPLLLRIRIEGPTPLHDALAGHPEKWRAQLVTLVARHPGVWLEKASFATRPVADESELPGLESAIAAELSALLSDETVREELARTLEPLRSATAPWLERPLDDEELLRERLDAVAGLLRERLRNAEQEPLL